ncbi:MAG: ABC transporter permease [Ruminococcaceae bacterium]|nr:ABC transporter permease [Oscillospiraceae bacterium]
MTQIYILIKRNVKLFFKDKAMFFTALITPAILLVLYATFLGKIYRDSFISAMPEGVTLPSDIINALAGGQLVSSILAVSCVTVAFCSNFLMVQDKALGIRKDFTASPVKPSVLSLSYYAATLFSTLIICLSAAAICLIYLAVVGWYLSVADVLLLFLDVLLLVLFGTAISSVISYFLSTQGQISAVGSVISAGYGFICGAYMPISSFGEGLQKVVTFLPGTYGTSLLRNHAVNGALAEAEKQSAPKEVVDALRDMLDCNLYFFDKKVSEPMMYIVLFSWVIVLIGVYVLLNKIKKKK